MLGLVIYTNFIVNYESRYHDIALNTVSLFLIIEVLKVLIMDSKIYDKLIFIINQSNTTLIISLIEIK